VRDLPDRPLALTLFRSTRRTVFTEGEPQGQLEGRLAFRYWISPVRGAIDRVSLCHAGLQLGAGLRNCQLPANFAPSLFVPVAAQLPAAASFLAVDGGVVVTSTRERAGLLEVRCFNPGTGAATATFDFTGRPAGAAAPAAAQRVDFEGRAKGRPAAVVRGRVRLRLRAKEILTVRFQPRP
jgi:alpha-mannosidase/mannosylglycerate hydrolase